MWREWWKHIYLIKLEMWSTLQNTVFRSSFMMSSFYLFYFLQVLPVLIQIAIQMLLFYVRAVQTLSALQLLVQVPPLPILMLPLPPPPPLHENLPGFLWPSWWRRPQPEILLQAPEIESNFLQPKGRHERRLRPLGWISGRGDTKGDEQEESVVKARVLDEE